MNKPIFLTINELNTNNPNVFVLGEAGKSMSFSTKEKIYATADAVLKLHENEVNNLDIAKLCSIPVHLVELIILRTK